MLEDPNAVDPGELGEFFESQADRANRAEPARPNNSTTRPKPAIVLAVMFASFAGFGMLANYGLAEALFSPGVILMWVLTVICSLWALVPDGS